MQKGDGSVFLFEEEVTCCWCWVDCWDGPLLCGLAPSGLAAEILVAMSLFMTGFLAVDDVRDEADL